MAKTNIPTTVATTQVPMYSRDRYMGEIRWVDGLESLTEGVQVPGYIEADFLPPKDGTGVLVTVKVADGDPRVTGLELYSDSGDVGIPPTAVSWVAKNLDRILTSALLNASSRVDPQGGALFDGEPDPKVEAAAHMLTGRAKRRLSDDVDHLRAVADVYNNNPADPRGAVIRQMFVSPRTADRRIAAARARGFIEKPAQGGDHA